MHSRGDHFSVRLERNAPAAAMAGCALSIGLLLIAIGAFPIYMTVTHAEPGSRGFFYLFGGAFGAVGLLLLYSGIHQYFAMATPQTVVEIESATLRRGSTVDVLVRQPGPASLQSLRANL